MGLGAALSTSFGTIIGVLFDNIGLGIALSASIGGSLGIVVGSIFGSDDLDK